MPRPRRGVVAFLAAVLIAGCGSGSPSVSPSGGPVGLASGGVPTTSAPGVPSPTSGGPGSEPGTSTAPGPSTGAVDDLVWDVPADPLHVDVELETAAAATKVIDRAGGSLTAVGSDGSRYTLTVPAQRFWKPTPIQLTPIARLSAAGEVAGAGDVFAVQLEPSGLELFTDASLRVEPATPLDDQAIAFFGYDGTGDDAGLHMPDLSAPGYVMPIGHFSGAGIVRRQSTGGGVDDEGGVFEVLVERVTSQVAGNRLDGLVARELARDRMATLAGVEPDRGKSIALAAEYQQSYLERVINPLLAVAAHPAATCEQAGEAAAALMGAERQRALLGAGDDEAALQQVRAAYEAAAERLEPLLEAACRRDAARKCRETGDLGDVVRRAYVEARAKSVLGAASDVELDASTEAYRAILRWCGVYELTWTSTGQIKNELYTVSSVIEGHMTLRYVEDEAGDISVIRLEGVTTSALVPFLSSVACKSFENRILCPPGADRESPTSGVVTDLELRLVYTSQVGGQAIIRTKGENRLVLDFGPSAMVLRMSVKTPAGPVPLPLEIYKAPWAVAHKPDYVDGIVRITDWERVGHPLMFKKTYAGTRPADDSTFSDSTELRFTHTPDPQP